MSESDQVTKSQILVNLADIFNVAESIANEKLANINERNAPQKPIKRRDSDKLQESDRPILLKYLKDLKEQQPAVKKLNKLYLLALNEYFSRKKLEKAFYELRPDEIRVNKLRYTNNLENIHKLKMQKDFSIAAFEEEKAKQLKAKQEAFERKNELTQGKNMA